MDLFTLPSPERWRSCNNDSRLTILGAMQLAVALGTPALTKPASVIFSGVAHPVSSSGAKAKRKNRRIGITVAL